MDGERGFCRAPVPRGACAPEGMDENGSAGAGNAAIHNFKGSLPAPARGDLMVWLAL
jgi:hypothetical protein